MKHSSMKLDLSRAHYLKDTVARRVASRGTTFRSLQERRASQNLTIRSNIGLMNEFISRRNSMNRTNTLADTEHRTMAAGDRDIQTAALKNRIYTLRHQEEFPTALEKAKFQENHHVISEKTKDLHLKVFDLQLKRIVRKYQYKQKIKEEELKYNLSHDVKNLLKDAIEFSKTSTALKNDEERDILGQVKADPTRQKKIPLVESLEDIKINLEGTLNARENLALHRTCRIPKSYHLKKGSQTESMKSTKLNTTTASVNNFQGKTQILEALGFGNYWGKDLKRLELDLESGKEYMVKWKIQDIEELRRMLRFRIVQEVMKIEERKNVRKVVSKQKHEAQKRRAAKSAAAAGRRF